LKLLGQDISLYILAMVQKSTNRYVRFTSTIYVRNGITFWEVCCNGQCIEFEITRELTSTIVSRTSTRLHQIHGIYVDFANIDTDVRYRISFQTRVSW